MVRSMSVAEVRELFADLPAAVALARTVEAPIAMGYVPTERSAVGTKHNALVRGVARPITITKMPLVPQRYYRG